MSKWTGVVVAALSSLVLAACGPVDGTETPEALGQQEAAIYICGDGQCNRGEPSTCPEDCGYGGYCGDGYCSGPETYSTCSQDCSSGGGGCLAAPEQREPVQGIYICGDGQCNRGEPSTCPEDCGYGGYCGDGYCSGPETSSTCYQDCRC
jgi:hypothetical protein